jgi:hypothetical protein
MADVHMRQPKEPAFNFDRETSWLRDEMARTGGTAKEELDRETAWHQEQLQAAFEPLRQGRKPEERREVTRERLEALDSQFAERGIADLKRKALQSEARSTLSPRLGSCVSAFAPYPADYNDENSGGIGAMHSHLDASIGQFGGLTFLAVGGSQWLGTGVGEWIYSGANSGLASVRADVSVWGRCVEYSALFGYFRNIVKVHVRTWDASGAMYDAQQVVHDNWEVIGLSVRDFSGATFNPLVWVPIQPYRWYLVWAWAEQYTVCGGVADGGTHLWLYADRLEVCV